MKTRDFTPLVGEKKSNPVSPMAVFEYYKNWPSLKAMKIIPEGFYFLVGVMVGKKRVDIVPDLFVQGYQPHSNSGPFRSLQRGYGKIFVGTNQTSDLTEEDIVLQQANLYQAKPDDTFELVMFYNEWREREKVEAFMQRFMSERKLEKLSEIGLYKYYCPKSRGYYLSGRKYKVWGMLVGDASDGQRLQKKVLIVDYHTGLPCVVAYEPEAFKEK